MLTVILTHSPYTHEIKQSLHRILRQRGISYYQTPIERLNSKLFTTPSSLSLPNRCLYLQVYLHRQNNAKKHNYGITDSSSFFSILATTNTYAETGTDGDDDINTGVDDDLNAGGGGDDSIDSDGGDDTNAGDNAFSGDGDGGDDNIDSGDGDDINVGDNYDGSGDGGDDTIKSGDGDDRNVGDNLFQLAALVMGEMIQ